MNTLFLVGLGGFLGSVSRYLMSGFVHRIANGSLFPFGTLAVNVTGCVAIGFLAGLSESRGLFTAQTRLLLFIGFLGGFTTFSTYSYETIQLLEDSQFLQATSNVFFHALLGLGGVWAGDVLSRMV